IGVAGGQLGIAGRQCGDQLRLGHLSAVVALLIQLGLEQRAQVGGTRGGAGFGHALDGIGRLGVVAGLDRQLDRARLAVDVDDHGFDVLAGLQHGGGVLDAARGDLGGAQVALDVDRQGDDRALGLDRLDHALHHGALVIGSDVVVERIAFQLLDAQRDAFLVGVDAQHHGFDFVALLEVADGLFAGFGPGQVGQVHQAVDAAGQADEHAEVGDRLDGATDLVATLEVGGELFPGVLAALLHAQRDAATVFVDLEDHDFDLFAQGHDRARIDGLVGAVHFGAVHQAFDTGLDLDERAVVGQVGDLAEQAGALRVATRQADPRIFAQLLDAQRDAALFLVELEDLGFDFLAHLQDLGGMTHAAPGHVGDVQQAVDAAQVDERTVVGDVLDHALDHGAFVQGLEQLLALFAHAGFQHLAARQHDVVALAVELDDLEFEGLAFVRGGVLDGTQVDQRARQERADAVGHDGQAALDLAGDGAGDQFAVFEGLF